MRTILKLSLILPAFVLLVACGGEEKGHPRGVKVYGVPSDTEPVETVDVEVGEASGIRPDEEETPTSSTPARPTPSRPARPSGRRGEYQEIEVTDGGTIRGVCKLDQAADRPMIPITKDKEACEHDEHASERVVYDEETLGLANCLVYLAEIGEGKAWEGEFAKDEDNRMALQDQVNCIYEPHVQYVRVNTQLAVKNSDPAEHNIHGYLNTVRTTAFNFGTAANSIVEEAGAAYLEREGKVILKCDIHPWMNAYVFVVKHPYHVVTDEKGRFVLENVPAGEYTLLCWHEGMEETPVVQDGAISGYTYSDDIVLDQQVTVTAGEEATVEFVLPAPK